jgi:hypothetical protein
MPLGRSPPHRVPVPVPISILVEVPAMKTMLLMLALLLSLVAGCGGGGDTAEKVFADMAANMKEMSAILTSVTDEASAQAAVPRIEAVRGKMRDCAKRARTVPRPDAETEQRLDVAMQAVQREVMPAIATARQRLAAQPELMAIVAPALQGMENDL